MAVLEPLPSDLAEIGRPETADARALFLIDGDGEVG
jgi:hypothetical protein